MNTQRKQITGNLEFPFNLQENNQLFGRDVQFAKAILKSNHFKMEDVVEAGRVAKAFDRYLFLMQSFDAIANDIFSEKNEELFTDKLSIYAKHSGLEGLLSQIESRNQETNIAKMKFLLELYQTTMENITEKTSSEQEELKIANKLLATQNPLSNNTSFCWKFLIIVLMCIAALLNLLTSGHRD